MSGPTLGDWYISQARPSPAKPLKEAEISKASLRFWFSFLSLEGLWGVIADSAEILQS